MEPNTVLVLANPTEPPLAMLEQLPPDTGIAAGNTPEAFERSAPDATVIFNWSGSPALLRAVFPMCPRVQWVHLRSAGMDELLFPELVASPAVLTNGRGVFSEALAEFVLGAVLFFAKDFRRLVSSQTAGLWDQFDNVAVAGQIIGIVGYGDIGRTVAVRARAFNMRVLALRRQEPLNPDPLVEQVYTPSRRLEMISRCDCLAVSAPLTPETRGMIAEPEFAAMKPEAVIINVGRGPVIDEPAMIRALSEKRIKGAALDVFDCEPLPEGHAFYKLENVLLSPHSADHTRDWLERAMRFFLDQFERFRKGEPLLNIVDKTRGY
jgi:phosphoglycerate dehydrogenase-like enzyme